MPRGAETAIGVDVGGTRIRAARIGRDGAILARIEEPVQTDGPGFAEQAARLVAAMRADGTVAVGMGLPGRVDGAGQRLVSAGYIDIAGLDVARMLAEATGLPVRIENDATMALIAEGRALIAEERGQGGLILMVTVGTGIGGAALSDGRPWYGGGFAGQFGHIAVAADGPRCKCGRHGCVETLSSGTALGRLIAAAGLAPGTRAEDLLARADASDAAAGALLDAWASPFERALHSLVAMADPARIVIGGGLGAAMTAALARLPQGSPWFVRPVSAARLGDDAGVVGAGLAAFDGARP